VLPSRVFPDPETTGDPTEGLPTNTTVADKKHDGKKTKPDNKTPTKPDDTKKPDP